MLSYADYYRALISGLGHMLLTAVVLSVIFYAIRRFKKWRRDKYFDNSHMAKIEKELKTQKETAKKVNAIKQRIFEETVFRSDVVDIVVNEGYEDEFGDMVDRVSDEYTQRQARAFLACALNLMAHSYKDLEEVRKVAHEMIEAELEY